MAYAPTVWVDGVTPVNAFNLNKLETGLQTAAAVDPTTLVPKDGAVTAPTRILANKLLAGDAQPAFRCLGDGKMEWGPGGATPPDISLYRFSPNVLASDVSIQSRRSDGGAGFHYAPATATGTALISMLQADTQPRFQVASTGHHGWGPGGSTAIDTTLYRAAAGLLKTDGQLESAQAGAFGAAFVARNLAANGYLLLGRQAGDTQERIYIGANGSVNWGSGAASQDTTLYRSTTSTLKTDGNLIVAGYVGFGAALESAAVTGSPIAKRILVLDATGASVGHIPIYS